MSDLIRKLRTGIGGDWTAEEAADEIERQARYIKSLEHYETVHKERIAELEAEKYVIVSGDSLRKDNETLKADNERLRAENDAWQNQDLLEQSNRQADEIERLTNEVSYLRTREKNHQNYIAGLEGDLEVMRLQRDAKRWTKGAEDEG